MFSHYRAPKDTQLRFPLAGGVRSTSAPHSAPLSPAPDTRLCPRPLELGEVVGTGPAPAPEAPMDGETDPSDAQLPQSLEVGHSCKSAVSD